MTAASLAAASLCTVLRQAPYLAQVLQDRSQGPQHCRRQAKHKLQLAATACLALPLLPLLLLPSLVKLRQLLHSCHIQVASPRHVLPPAATGRGQVGRQGAVRLLRQLPHRQHLHRGYGQQRRLQLALHQAGAGQAIQYVPGAGLHGQEAHLWQMGGMAKYVSMWRWATCCVWVHAGAAQAAVGQPSESLVIVPLAKHSTWHPERLQQHAQDSHLANLPQPPPTCSPCPSPSPCPAPAPPSCATASR